MRPGANFDRQWSESFERKQIMKSNTPTTIITIAGMCRLLKMSRSQFYIHLREGHFHKPLLNQKNRPFYTPEMATENLKVRSTGIGINGEYVLFYERLIVPASKPEKPDYSSLVHGLSALGIDVTMDQLEAAIKHCFAEKSIDSSDTKVLRTIFRHFKSNESG